MQPGRPPQTYHAVKAFKCRFFSTMGRNTRAEGRWRRWSRSGANARASRNLREGEEVVMRKSLQARRVGTAVLAMKVVSSAFGVAALAAVVAAPGKWS